MSTHCSQHIGHFQIKVRTSPDTGFYGWDTSELRFRSVLWTLQNLNLEVSREHFRTLIRKCPMRNIFTLAAMSKFTVFLQCIMFITKYLIVKNICILYLLSWWGFSTSLGEKLVFCCCPDDFILYKFPHFLFLIDWLRCNKLNSNWKLVTDNRSGTCTGSNWSFPPKLGTMCSTFSFVLIHLKVICTLHEGGKCV